MMISPESMTAIQAGSAQDSSSMYCVWAGMATRPKILRLDTTSNIRMFGACPVVLKFYEIPQASNHIYSRRPIDVSPMLTHGNKLSGETIEDDVMYCYKKIPEVSNCQLTYGFSSNLIRRCSLRRIVSQTESQEHLDT